MSAIATAHARTSTTNGFGFGTSGAGLRFTAFGVRDYNTAGTTLSVGQWQHVAAVFQGGNVTFYLDGAARETITGTAWVNADPDDLLLVGDENLMARLLLGVNRPLLSRLGFCLSLSPWAPEDMQAYLRSRFQEASIHAEILEPQAEHLLVQAAGGIPRTVNHLAQRAMEHAARAHSKLITAEHVRRALQQLPWLGRMPEGEGEARNS